MTDFDSNIGEATASAPRAADERTVAEARGRVGLLVCGYEEAQRAGRTVDEYCFERWWIHAAVFSCQGERSIEWWPVPLDTRAGDIFVFRLASFEVPSTIREGLRSGSVAIGEGDLGEALDTAASAIGAGVFGFPGDAETVRLPRHPEFDPSTTVIGDGLFGLGVAFGEARNDGRYPVAWAPVGSVIPFPSVIPEQAVRGLGTPFDDLDTPLEARNTDELWIQPEAWAEFRDILRATFGDPELEEAITRLQNVSAALASGAAFPRAEAPSARWDFL